MKREDRIREIGKEIYDASRAEIPSVFDKSRWIGSALEWAMKDEAFKIRLFRFIDVLPSLKTDTQVIQLLKEYFSDDGESQGILKWGIKGLPRKGMVSSLAGKMIRQNVENVARQFIAGTGPDALLPVLVSLREAGFAFGIDILGEVVVSEREAESYAARYAGLLDTIRRAISEWEVNKLLDHDDKGSLPVLNISLKISSLYSQLDPVDWEGSIEGVKKNLVPIFRKAMNAGASVTFDMEHYHIKDLTIAVFKSIMEEEEFSEWPFAGIAIQAYLRDSKKDLADLITWAKHAKRSISVRLVKGAYWDYEIAVNRQKEWPVPIFLNKADTDYNFEELATMLLQNSEIVRPAIASHNIRSISRAIAEAEALGLPKEAYEFQMLYGMAEPIRKAVGHTGHRVRVYTPMGELLPGMAYLVRRLLENTSNESFLRKSFTEDIPFDELISAPQQSSQTGGKENREGFTNEPLLDFSRSENRKKMRDSLEKLRKNFGKRYPISIGGKEVWKDEETPSLNPADPEEVVGRVSVATTNDAEHAIEEARRAFAAWRKASPAERADCLRKAAVELRKKREELASLQIYEVGKSWKEADGDVAEAIDYLEYYAGEMARLGTPRTIGTQHGEINEYTYEPKGVGAVIAPWNFPLAISTGMVSAGIVTGNCVIYKPSGLSPVTGWELVDAFRRAGLPAGVLQYLNGPGKEIGEFLAGHRDIDFITFTGSMEVGLRIIETAARTLSGQRSVKKVIAEMGGKNAIIIDETADMDDAVKGVLESALGYQGQKCSACSRVIVTEDMYEEFCSRLRDAMDSIHIGPTEDPGNYMGPLIDEHALNKTKRYIEIGKQSGKTLLLRPVKEKGYFAGPSIFTDIPPDSPLAGEEIFGPVLSVFRVKDIDEALELANNTEYALTGGIFSRSPAHIEKARREFRVGNLYINRQITGAVVGRQPFGGFGMSGIGSKAGGPDYLLQFMNPKSISENAMRKGFAPLE